MKKHVDLGEIKVGSKHTISFKVGDTSLINSLISSCGCSKPYVKGDTVYVKYTAKSIPKHKVDSYEVTNKITVGFLTGEKEIFTFSAKVVK